MNIVVRDTLEAAEAAHVAVKQAAGLAAEEAALPFKQARLRAEEAMRNNLTQAKVLATRVGRLKQQALEMARESQAAQRQNSTTDAHRMQDSARELMKEAQELESQAKGFQRMAEATRGGLGIYALRAKAAATRAAQRVNPGGDGPLLLPPPPPPLRPAPRGSAK
uniref:Uncharacterized protein n=1 Tax=Alexandrium monilatum TaxID=311494 RepID=A0A7S4UMN6_9DINO